MSRHLPHAGWPDLAARLKRLPRSGLVGLLKDLYHAEPAARNFLQARLEVGPLGSGQAAAFDAARRDVETLLDAAMNPEELPIAQARKRIAAYRKASLDPAGTARLELMTAERGLRAIAEGAAGSTLSGTLSILRGLAKFLLSPDGKPVAAELAPELRHLARLSRSCGYGLADDIPAWVDDLLRDVPEGVPARPAPRRFDGDPDFDTA